MSGHSIPFRQTTRVALLSHIIILTSVCLFLLSGCSKPKATDIDYLATSYAKAKSGFIFEPNCKKPKEFRGISKFKVDCLVSTTDQAWERSFSRSHGSFIFTLGNAGYRHIGSTTVPGHPIKPRSTDEKIQVYEKSTRLENCNRRIYIDFREFGETLTNTPQGARLIIADPWVLFCIAETSN